VGKAEIAELTLYSRQGCHLCDEMITGLQALQARFSFELSIVDIDRDPELADRYGTEVPVLAHAGRELCRHTLATALVTDYLVRIG
jgi:thioredoxin reductase (NADPH)